MNTEKVIQHISNWLKNYSDNSSTSGFVIGVSGGIDSAVTSTLCALTQKKVVCLNLPLHQDKMQLSRAEEQIHFLESKFENVSSVTIDLTDAFESLKKALPKSEETSENIRLSLANTRSRLRMSTLYYVAQSNGMLVVGTGNKIEDFGVGFFTKYGDGGVDLSPIADLTKTQVFELGRVLGVPKSILEAPPTDGLWGDERTDEQQIGASYPELEWAMELIEKNNGDYSKIMLDTRQKEVLEIYLRFNRVNKHKMLPIPVCEIPKEILIK